MARPRVGSSPGVGTGVSSLGEGLDCWTLLATTGPTPDEVRSTGVGTKNADRIVVKFVPFGVDYLWWQVGLASVYS